MAKRSKRGGSSVRAFEKSLSDAQKVVAGYISSGSDQITGTLRSLQRIFSNRQLAAALKKARAAQLAVANTVGGRGSAKKRKAKKTTARRKTKARGTAAKRRVKAASKRRARA